MNDCVILREMPTACGRRFGHATLNAPQRLNALSLDMIDHHQRGGDLLDRAVFFNHQSTSPLSAISSI